MDDLQKGQLLMRLGLPHRGQYLNWSDTLPLGGIPRNPQSVQKSILPPLRDKPEGWKKNPPVASFP